MTLFLYYAQIKNYQGLDEVLRTRRDPVKTDFMPDYPDANRWSTTHHVHITTVDPGAKVEADGLCPVRYQMMVHMHITDTNLQKELLSEYKRNSKNKSQEYAKFLADKKSLITILFGQYDEATQTKISLGDTYTADRGAGRLLAFIEQMRLGTPRYT